MNVEMTKLLSYHQSINQLDLIPSNYEVDLTQTTLIDNQYYTTAHHSSLVT